MTTKKPKTYEELEAEVKQLTSMLKSARALTGLVTHKLAALTELTMLERTTEKQQEVALWLVKHLDDGDVIWRRTMNVPMYEIITILDRGL